MNTFVIIFRQGPHTFTEDELARRQREVSAWARKQNEAGYALEPRILASESVTAGAHAPGDWPLTALLFLNARDIEDAKRVAESHPALQFNVAVEVRRWAPPSLSR